MISQLRNKLFDVLVKMPPEQLNQYLQRAATSDPRAADPNAPPAYLIAAAMQEQKALRQAGQSPPRPQPTVVSQLAQEMSPPPASQGLGSLPPSPAMSNPSAPAPSLAQSPMAPPQEAPPAPQAMARGGSVHDYGVASLPYEADYKEGGVVAFAGGDWIHGYEGVTDPEDPRLSSGIASIAKRAEQEGALTPEEMAKASLGYSSAARTALENWGGGDTTPPAPPASSPKDPLADADVSLHDPRQEFLDRLHAGAGAGGGEGGNLDTLFNKYSGMLSGSEKSLNDMAAGAAPKTYAGYMKERQAADEAAGVDTAGYESRRAAEIGGLESEFAKDRALKMQLLKSKAWGALADPEAKNFFDAARRAMNTYSEGVSDITSADAESNMLLRKLRMNQEDQTYARKVGDRNALLKLREDGENLERDLKIKAVDVGARSKAAALRSATDQLRASQREAGATARQNAVIEAGLLKSSDAAKTQMAQIAARYGLSMAQITSRDKKDRMATALKLRQDPVIFGKAQKFAEDNPNMKVNGKPVDPLEYFLKGYTKDWFKMMGDLHHAASGGNYMLPGGISPVDTEDDGEDGVGFDWEQGY